MYQVGMGTCFADGGVKPASSVSNEGLGGEVEAWVGEKAEGHVDADIIEEEIRFSMFGHENDGW